MSLAIAPRRCTRPEYAGDFRFDVTSRARKLRQGVTQMMRGFSTIAKATTLAALMIFVGCSDDGDRVIQPGPDSSAIPEMAMAPGGPIHRVVSNGDMLRWNAPANADEAGVVGYNVYVFDPAPETTESYVRFNSSTLTTARLIVRSFEEGETVHYRVAAVNADGEEGTWSSPTSFVAAGPAGGRSGLPTQEGF